MFFSFQSSCSKYLTVLATGLTVVGLVPGFTLEAQSGPIRNKIREEVISQRGEEIVDRVAQKMIDKVNSSSCDQLHASMKSSAASGGGGFKDKIMTDFFAVLRQNPALKTEFFQQVSVPLATKLFDCGMIPPQD
uniref:Uncharacterized protein n=1 Tax=Cyanothece sp. (strain PCC 7425 / ATCC 29141) TaxID=395961 RepID=B8HQR0_CYAP4